MTAEDVLPRRDQIAIVEAAIAAHENRDADAEAARKRAGYHSLEARTRP